MSYEEKLDLVLARLHSLLVAKHHDYGENNLKKYGLFGILVRLSDKMSRLEHIQSGNMINETQYDTWSDIAGYAIQALVIYFD